VETKEQSHRRPLPDWLIREGYEDEKVRLVKSGKEAQVWLVHRHTAEASCLLALKAYKPRLERSFRNDAIYQEGWVIKSGQVRRAVKKRTRFGQKAISAMWTANEFAMLRKFWKEGADVPYAVEEPAPCMHETCPDGCFRQIPNSFLMEYLGDWETPAPRLVDLRLPDDLLPEVFDRIMRNVELFVRLGFVHADLSAYNVLWWDEKPWIIDFPQAVMTRHNQSATDLLYRDLENLCSYFRRRGLERDPGEQMATLMDYILFGA
jgi:RIO kinase 1